MTSVKFTIKGLDQLKKALKQDAARATEQIALAVERSALFLEGQAKKEAPVNKQPGGGNLRQNIKSSLLSKTRAEVVAKSPYALFVELGTAPHTIRVKNKKGLANKRQGLYFGPTVSHPGTKANPFMQRALQKSQAEIQRLFSAAIKNAFKK